MLNLILAIETTREEVPETTELEFFRNRLRTLGRLQDRRQRGADTLDESTSISLLTWKNQSGLTVLQDETVDQDNLKMMLALVWSVVNKNPFLIPEVKAGILNLGDSSFFGDQERPLTSSTLAELMTHKNSQGETILQEKNLSERSYNNLISLALSVLASVPRQVKSKRKEEEEEKEETKRLQIVA